MKSNLIILLFILLILSGCSKHKKIEKLLKSNNESDIIEASYLIGETKDTTFVCDLFDNIYDPRISYHYKFKGMSVYYGKIIALYKISGLKRPNKIKLTTSPGSIIVNFYKDWALKKGYKCFN